MPGCIANSAFLLVDQRRFAEAWQEAEISLRLEPHEGPTYHLRAVLLCREGRIAEAKESLRQALTQSIDNVYAAHELLDLCNSLAERREALDFIREELKRQVTFGDGLLTFRELAHGTLDARRAAGGPAGGRAGLGPTSGTPGRP